MDGSSGPHSTQIVKNINILVLGETGVGKSTWINSFANYLAFNTLEEAEKNEFVTVIPASFTITDDNYQERTITTGGVDSNEVLRAGESATQRPRTYKFAYNNNTTVITLIDTPGIGDSRGPAQDKLNFQMIMDHLAYHKEVHGICILMKPNNARLTVLFEFCIKHLLTHLHRDAIKNIVFCFTNARNTFYRPGNTLPALKALLEKYKDLDLPLNKETMYCLDNESFQFLVAVQQGINFDEQRDIYSKSWEMSSRETHRLLDHVLQLEPHQLQNTLSINDARRVVIGLTKPLADIASNIQQNISVAKDKQAEIQNAKADRSMMVQQMYIPVIQCKLVWLDRPLQVCENGKCCKTVTLDSGEKALQYYCKKPANPAPGGGMTEKLRRLMRPSACSRCKCPKSKHAILDYDIVEEWTQQPMPGLEEKLQQMDGNLELIRSEFLSGLLDRIKCLEDEQVKIIQVCSLFAFFLKNNAIAPYNDTMIRYLEQNIEKTKLDQQPNQAELQRLEKMKEDYQKEVGILEENMANAASIQDVVRCTDIPILKEQLISLPINGQKIKDTLVQQERRFAAGEEMFDSMLSIDSSDGQNSSDKKKKFVKQASITKIGHAEKRGGLLFNVFQNPNKARPMTTPPAITPRVPPPLPAKPGPGSAQYGQQHGSTNPPVAKPPALNAQRKPENMGVSYNNSAVAQRHVSRDTPVQFRPIAPTSKPVQAEKVWVPNQPTLGQAPAGLTYGLPNPVTPPAKSQPPPVPTKSSTPMQTPPAQVPSLVSKTPSVPAAAGPAPPPPPPAPPLELPVPDGADQGLIHQRSALMDDIRNNKLKLKTRPADAAEGEIDKKPVGSPVSKEPVSMDAALKKAIMERFHAHNGTVVDSFDEWADQ